MPIIDKQIILASKSPRRQQLLRDAGIDFIVRTIDVEEDFPEQMPVEEVASFLARKKALAARGFLSEKAQVLLTADSTVILDGIIHGKPVDAADAARILRLLSGRRHLVVTGVCLMSLRKETLFSNHSWVEFGELSEAEIAYYIERYQPFDKAGAYAIQEWIGLRRVRRIEGSYSNIIGLPVSAVYEELLRF
jgi:septum formation protein